MKYLVMETHLSYAVVLDDSGNFIKCANMNYHVGQKVNTIEAMQAYELPVQAGILQKIRQYFWIPSLAAALAIVLVVASLIQQYTTFASVYLAINPEVRMDINKNETVIGLAGLNADGEFLIQDYTYKKKDLDTVMNELIDRAIAEGFLSEGGKVRIDLATRDAEWQQARQPKVRENITNHVKDKMKVTIEVDGEVFDNKIIIPIGPRPVPTDDSLYDASDYGVEGESDYDAEDDSDYEIEDDSKYDQPSPTPTPLPLDDDSGYDDSEYGDSEYDD